MNLFSLSFQYFRARPLHAALSMLLLTLGLSLMVSLLSVNDQLKGRLSANAKGVNLVVGAKGSPLQLILCNVFQVDFPTGNIDLGEARPIAAHRLVKNAIPLALGDSYRGYRLVGTNYAYPALYEAELAQGAWFERVLEVTVGARAAEQLGVAVGDALVSDHGFATGIDAHEAHAYRVVGILHPTYTVLDEVILTGIESFWVAHDQVVLPHDAPVTTEGLPTADSLQITSLLLQYRSPMAAVQLPRLINTGTNLQAASPAFETARLFELLGVGIEVLQAFAVLVLVVAALSIFLSLFNALKERQYDLAVMRAMGARRRDVFALVLMESAWITLLGGVAGLALGHGLVAMIANNNEAAARIGLSGSYWLGTLELGLLGLGVLLGVVASLFPAWRAYRQDISDTLSQGGA